MTAMSPQAQKAAAAVYVKEGKKLDWVEKKFPELKAGVDLLRQEEKSPPASRRGSGPSGPISTSVRPTRTLE